MPTVNWCTKYNFVPAYIDKPCTNKSGICRDCKYLTKMYQSYEDPSLVCDPEELLIDHTANVEDKESTTFFMCGFPNPPVPIKKFNSPCPVFSNDPASPQFGENGCTNCKYLIFSELPQRIGEIPKQIKINRELTPEEEARCEQQFLAENPDFLEID
jgi:hypothetical protein